MRMPVRAVIFDQDGLMFDTERISLEAWQKVSEEYGIRVTEEFLSRVRGGSVEDGAGRFAKFYGPKPDFQEIREKKQNCFHEFLREQGLPVKKGLQELLAYLKEHGYGIALATSSPREWSMNNLDTAGVRQYFDVCVCGDSVTRCKPDPEIFVTAAGLLGKRPEECLVLEDSLNGVDAALAGGFQIIMVPDLTRPDQETEERVTAVCESLLDVMRFLEEQGSADRGNECSNTPKGWKG